MVLSTSIPSGAPKPAPDESVRFRLSMTSLSAQLNAIDQLLALARRRIRVFDLDLKQWNLDTPARVDRLGLFLRGARGNTLDIIVHDASYIDTRCTRLKRLLRSYSDAVTIYQTGPEAKVARDPLLLIDDLHYLHRFRHDQPRAGAGFYCAEETSVLLMRFEEIWATGEPGVGASVLGL